MQQRILRAATAAILGPALLLGGCGSDEPAPAPTSTAAPAASGYQRDANATLAALATSAAAVAEVLAKPEPASGAWRSTLNGKLDVLAQVDGQAKALRPTAADAELHQRLLEITGDFNRAAQLLRTSIEPVNTDALAEAAQLLSASVTKVAILRAALPQS